METVISKSYGGAQTRLILPKEKDVAGVTGDNRSTRLRFKLPKPYATGWSKFIEFDCTVERDYSDMPGVTRSTEGPTEIYPCYPLESDDSFLVPYEIASQGGEIRYNLKFVSEDGTVVEKSELGTLYFRNSVDGDDTEPEEYVDIVTILANNAYCSVSYDDGTREGTSETVLPTLTFTPWMSGGESDTITLNVPYLDSNGHILNRFIDKEIVVEIFHISSPDALVSLTQAQIPDMALIDQSASTESYYMDLYMLVGADPRDATNWYLVHTDNPTFGSVSATSADFNSTTTVGLTVTGDEAVSGNVAVTGQVTTAQVNTPKIAGTGTSPNAPLEITGDTTVKDGLTVQGTLASKSITDNGESVSIIKDISATGSDVSVRNQTVSGKTTTGTLESGAATFTGNIDASNKTVTASTFIGNVTGDVTGNATTATTAQNYDSTTGTIKQHVDTHGADLVYGHVKFKENITANTIDTTVSEKGIKDFVNSSINAVAAYYITYNAQGDRFPSAEALKTASTLYSGGQVRVPTRNDYAVVMADATHMEYSTYYPYTSFTTTAQYVDHYVDYNNAKTLVTQANKDSLGIVPGTTVAYEGIASDARYIYAGTGDTYDGTKWEYNFPLGRTFTNAEMLAIDSGITADKVNKLDGIASGAQVNVLEAVKVNGTALSITNKAVDISVTPNDESTTYVDWDTSTTIATVAGTPIKIKIPANPDTDQLVRQKLQTGNYNLPLILAHNTITSTDENVTDIVYRNNSIYANPSTGSIYATKVYSNNSEVVNLADDQSDITGVKTFSNLRATGSFVIGNSTTNGALEIFHTSPFIDFHYNRSTSDFTSRLIETSPGIFRITTTDGTNTGHFTLYSNSAKPFATVPARDYVKTNTNDILTIGTLNSAIEIDGDKTFNGVANFLSKPIFFGAHDNTYIDLRNSRFSGNNYSANQSEGLMALMSRDSTPKSVIALGVRQWANPWQRCLNVTIWNNDGSAYNQYNLIDNNGYVYSTTPSAGDSSIKVATTEFVGTALGNYVTLATDQTITAKKTFAGVIPTTQPANGASSNSYEVQFYGGSRVDDTSYINFDNIVAVNKDNQSVALWGPFQSGTNNDNGTNGFRVGLRDRSNTAWTHFLNMYHNGELAWDGYARVTGARAYNASNTSDVVTIGSLQSSTDVVHTSGDEEIAGNKTFTGQIRARNSLRCSPTSSTLRRGIVILKSNGTTEEYFIGADTDTSSLFFRYADSNNATQTALGLTNTGILQAYKQPAYASLGSTDVLVKSHVPDLISANVGNGQISLTSSRGVAIDNFTVNQSSGKNIVLPAGSTQYTDQSMTFSLQSTPDFSDYPYMASKSITGLTADMYATVTFDDAQVSSGQYAPFCQTLAGEVRLYAKSNVGTITVPTISVGMDDSSAQQSMSNFVTLSGAQDITGIKTVYTTGYSALQLRSTRTTATDNIGGIVFVDYYQQTRGALAGQVNGSISLVPVSGQSAWVNGQRAYNSSNTSDIVTIGSLQASTDVVHRSGDETVNGSKGFAGELYVPGVFTYKTKLFSGNNNYGGKYNRIAVLTPGSLGGAVVGMIWSSKGHNSTFRNRNGIIYMRARPSSGLLDFIWMVKGSGVANEQLALTYNGTNVELWGLCDTDSANESLIFSLMSEANSGGSATNIFTIAEDSVKTRAEIVAYNNYAFSG